MTLRSLQIFRAVAQTGNFTKAAVKLYITQSAVSHAIRELEDLSGTALFDRLPKSVRLTPCGELLLKEIIPILNSCDTLELKIGNLERIAPIKITSSITIATFWLPSILCSYQKEWPDTRVEVNVVSAANALKILQEGNADFALIEGVIPQGPYNYMPFSSYQLQAACAPAYSQQQTFTVQEFCMQNLLLREKGSAIRDALDSMLLLRDCVAQPVWTSVNSLSLIEAAKSGLGITVLPEMLLRDSIEQGTLIPINISGTSLQNQLTVIWHRDKYITDTLSALLDKFRHLRGSPHTPIASFIAKPDL